MRPAQIDWLSGHRVRVKLGTKTGSQIRNDNVYELPAKFPDESYVTVRVGKLHVKDSIVDTP